MEPINSSNHFAAVERASEGFRAYLTRVYNFMAGGLVVSGLSAYAAAREPLLSVLYTVGQGGMVSYSVLGWIAILSPLVLIFMIGSQLNKLNLSAAQGLFWLFSALMGVSLSNVFLLYSGESIVRTFLVSAGSFAALSLYGNSTKRDLSTWGRFLYQGLIGLILVIVVNLFLKSSGVNFLISVVGVFLFAGLTAYDTQKLKTMYAETDSADVRDAKAISGALALYLDFINLFMYLLSFLGNRKN